MLTPLRIGLGVVLIGWLASSAVAGPAVNVVIGPQPPDLVKLAADEMSDQLQKLFEAEVEITAKPVEGAKNVILLGNPQTNPTLAQRIGNFWPELTDQGIVVRSFGLGDGQSALAVGGGSPAATLWAAYELGRQFGIRYLLAGDLMPIEQPEFRLGDFNLLLEPTMRTRGWQIMDLSPEGYGGWGADDYRKLFRQLAKLKFNRLQVVAPVLAQAPLIRYEYQGSSNTDKPLLDFPRLKVDGDTAGRRAFAGAKEYVNPEFAAAESNDDRLAAGTTLLQQVIDAGHELGFSVLLEVSPAAHGDTQPMFLDLRGANQDEDDEALPPGWIEPDADEFSLASAKLLAYVKLYPALDGIVLSGRHAAQHWQHAKTRKAAWLTASDGLLVSATTRAAGRLGRPLRIIGLPTGMDEGQTDFPIDRGDPLAIAVSGYSSDADPRAIGFGRSDYNELPKLLHPQGPRGICRVTLYPVDDFLPAAAHGYLGGVLKELQGKQWDGILLRMVVPGDYSVAADAISQAAFGSKLAFGENLRQTFLATAGSQDVADRCMAAYDLAERADMLGPNIQPDILGSAGLYLRRLRQNGHRIPVNAHRIAEKRDLYTKATDEFFRAHDGCHPQARPMLYYHCKRGEFSIHFLNFVEAMLAAETAKAKGQAEERAAQLQKALESIYNACNSLSEVARDPSDRGLIALINEQAYRPLKKIIEEEEEEEE
ncbi:MAG: hypothetical protein AB7O62_00750 [Pirellulales bacterium]